MNVILDAIYREMRASSPEETVNALAYYLLADAHRRRLPDRLIAERLRASFETQRATRETHEAVGAKFLDDYGRDTPY